MLDVSRADGTSATHGLSGQMDWLQGGERRSVLLQRDTDLWKGESGGLGGLIDDDLVFRHLFRSQVRNNVEGGIGVFRSLTDSAAIMLAY